MAGTQTNNLVLYDSSIGLNRIIETGGTPDDLAIGVDVALISGANMVIDGDLTVNGTTTTIHTEQMNVEDNNVLLNANYTTVTTLPGGLTVNYLPTSTNDTVAGAGFTAGVPATSNPTVGTTGASTFSAGDLVLITDANDPDNMGLFEVDSHAANVLTVRGVGTVGATVKFVTNQFTTDSTTSGTITRVNVGTLQAGTDGAFEVATGSSTTGLTFYDLITTNTLSVTLQQAYVAGNTITTDATEGDVVVAGSEQLLVTATGGVDIDTVFDFDGTSFDVLMTGSNGFSIDGTAASNVTVTAGTLTLSSVTSGDVDVTSADAVNVTAGNEAAAAGNDVNITAGDGGGASNDGGNIILTSGDHGSGGDAGYVDITGPNDEGQAVLQLGGTGSNAEIVQVFAGSSSPSASVTGLAGSLFLRDTGSGGEVYVNTSTGSGTAWTQLASGAGNSLQQAYVVGNTITTDATEGDVTITGTEDLVITLSDLLVDTTAAISLDADSASNFTVAGGNLTLSTTTSGTLAVSSAADVDIDAATTVTVNTTNAADASGNDITLTAASSTAGTAGGASIILTPGDGDTTGVAGFVDITGPNDEDEEIVRLTTGGTNGDSVSFFVGDSDPSASVTGLAGSLFFRDTGSGAELFLNTSTTSGTTWTQIATGGTVTLQNAYVGGNTITTNATEGDFTITGTEDLIVSTSDLLVDTTAAISLDADSASNFTVAGGNLTLSTTTSGTLAVSSAADVDIDAATTVTVNTTNAADASGNDITLTAASSTSGTAGGASIILTPGDGNTTGVAGFVDITGPNDGDEEIVRLTTGGTNGNSASLFVGDSDPDGSVTGLAGSLFLRDTGSGGELYVNESTASGTTWNQVVTSGAGGSLTLQNAYVGGNTITTDATEGDVTITGTEDLIVSTSDLLVDTTASISLDADTASNFTVAGANLTLSTTTSGTLFVASAGDVDITAGSDINMTFQTNNSTAMVIDDGTNNFVTFDSTTSKLAVEVNEFLDIVGSGAGITLTAGEAIAAGDLITIEDTTGDAILADANTGTAIDGIAIGVAAYAAADTAPVQVYTVTGSLIPMTFASAPASNRNGDPVYLSSTPGRATLTAPTSGPAIVWLLGVLQGADGAETSPLVLYMPQFVNLIP